MKNNKGITLISLSVTVSVLVILAGVTISTAVGENGFIEQIKRAKERTEQEVSQGTANIENTKIIITSYTPQKDLSEDTFAPTELTQFYSYYFFEPKDLNNKVSFID